MTPLHTKFLTPSFLNANLRTTTCNAVPLSDDFQLSLATDPAFALARASKNLAFMPPRCNIQDTRGPKGRQGPPGKNAGSLDGKTGTAFDASNAITECDYQYLASTGIFSQWQMVLHEAESNFLSEKFEQCAISLTWLACLTNEIPSFSNELVPHLNNTVNTFPNQTEIKSFRDRVVLLISRLNSGLDFYGLPYNYVPLVALDTYKDTVKGFLDIAQDIETTCERYRTAVQNKQEQLAALDAAILAANNTVLVLTEQSNKLKNDADEAQKAKAVLEQEMNVYEKSLFDAEDDFKNKIADQAKCSFLEVVNFITTIVTVAEGAYQNTKKIVDEVSSIIKEGGEIKGIVEKVRVITAQVGELRDAYNKIKDIIKDSPNAAKITVNRSDFEEILKPYLNLPEAQAYRNQIRRLFDTADARNQKILEFTAISIKYLEIDAELNQRAEEIQRIERIKAQVRDPNLIECATFIQSLNARFKTHVIRAINQEFKAYEYWALDFLKFPFLGDQDVARLAATHGTILQAQLNAMENRGRGKQTFADLKITLKQENFSDRWKSFQEKGKLAFQIFIDNPEFEGINTDLTVASVSLEVPNITTDNNSLRADLIHLGQSMFKKADGTARVFLHRPRDCFLWYDLDSHKSFVQEDHNLGGENGKYEDLSPFASWVLVIDPLLNSGLNLSAVNEVSLTFSGSFARFLP